MTQVSLSALKVNAGKYVSLAEANEEVIITRNGKVVAKIVSAKPDKKAAWNSLTEIFKGVQLTDSEIETDREERIGR